MRFEIAKPKINKNKKFLTKPKSYQGNDFFFFFFGKRLVCIIHEKDEIMFQNSQPFIIDYTINNPCAQLVKGPPTMEL